MSARSGSTPERLKWWWGEKSHFPALLLTDHPLVGPWGAHGEGACRQNPILCPKAKCEARCGLRSELSRRVSRKLGGCTSCESGGGMEGGWGEGGRESGKKTDKRVWDHFFIFIFKAVIVLQDALPFPLNYLFFLQRPYCFHWALRISSVSVVGGFVKVLCVRLSNAHVSKLRSACQIWPSVLSCSEDDILNVKCRLYWP